ALWSVFSLLAVAAQWMLERTGALSVLMNSRSLSLSGALLIAAGIYQLTPFKTACLEQCRAPAVFIAPHWRRGALGGWRMGSSTASTASVAVPSWFCSPLSRASSIE